MANYGVFFLHSCILLQVTRASFVENIVSEVVITGTVGQRLVLPCTPTVNRSVRWLYQPSESSEAGEIFFNGFIMNGNRRYFEVPSAGSGNYALVVKEASLANSGIYTCWEENGQGDQHIVHLAVMRNPEVVLVKSSSTVTTSTTTLEYEITDSPGAGSKTVTSTIVIVTVFVVLLLLGATLIAVLLFTLRRKIGLCREPFPGCCKPQRDGLEVAPLLYEDKWKEIAELERSVYNTRKQNPKEWTNNRFVVGVARKPALFAQFLKRLEDDVRKKNVEALVGINSADCRGELIAAPLASHLRIPYVSVSMKATSHQLHDVDTETFQSTNGETVTLEVAKDEGLVGKKVVIIDSFYLTGRSLKAAQELVERALRVTIVESIVFTAVGVPTDNRINAIFVHNEQVA